MSEQPGAGRELSPTRTQKLLRRSMCLLGVLAVSFATVPAQGSDASDQTEAIASKGSELRETLLGSETAKLCREKRADLSGELALAPRDLDLLLIQQRCSALLGPDDKSAAASAALERQVAYLLRDGRGRDPGFPAAFSRITTPITLAMVLGMVPYAIAVVPSSSNPSIIVAVAMRDTKTGEERWVYGEVFSQMNAPTQSRAIGAAMMNLAFIRATFSKKPTAGGGFSLIFWLLAEPQEAASAESRAAYLRASNDNPFLAIPVMLACFSDRMKDCAEESVDQLLEYSELDLGLGHVGLALAHALGTGVRADSKRALQLMDKANAVLGPEAAATQAAFWLATVQVLAEKPLKVNAQFSASLKAKSDYAREALDQNYRSDADRPKAQFDAVPIAMAGGDVAAALKHLRRSANLGYPPAMLMLGNAWLRGDFGLKPNAERAEFWLQRAADLGSHLAAAQLAELIQDRSPDDAKRATNLLAGTVKLSGASVGLTAYTELLLRSGSGPRPAAERVFRSLLDLAVNNSDKTVRDEARFLLARMRLRGEGLQHDVVETYRELLALAKDADPKRTYQIALTLHESELKAEHQGEIRKLLTRAAEGGSAPAMELLGRYWLQGLGGRQSDLESLRWFELAIEAGYFDARNIAAWVRCTAADAGVRDAAKTTEWIEEMKATAAPEALAAAWQSTIAACAAAKGNFADAIVWQERALAKEGNAFDNQARLELYRANQPYIETPTP